MKERGNMNRAFLAVALTLGLLATSPVADTIKYKVGGVEVTKDKTGGKAYYKYVYDDAGHIKTTFFYGKDGKPALDFRRVHRTEWTTDDNGNTTSLTYFGVKGEKVTDDMGVHHKVTIYRSSGEIETIKNYGVDGNEITPKYIPKPK